MSIARRLRLITSAIQLSISALLVTSACSDRIGESPTALRSIPLHSSAAQQVTRQGFFEISGAYESVTAAGNGTFGVEYCAGTFYGRFHDVPCETSSEVPAGMGSPAMFLSTDGSRNLVPPARNGVTLTGSISGN